MKQLNILGIRKRVFLDHSNIYSVVMQPITDEEYKKLKQEKQAKGQCSFNIKNNDGYNVFIPPSDVIIYGDLDINKRSDIAVIKRMENKIWDRYNNHWLYTNMDYKEGIIFPNEDRKSYEMSQTFNIVAWIKYNLVYLGNPKNIIVYKIGSRFIKENAPNILKR